jgi:hypothetical protein
MVDCLPIFALVASFAVSGSSPQPASQADVAENDRPAIDLECKGEAEDAWLSDWRERFLHRNLLVEWATNRLGAPNACEAKVTSRFDGEKFGRLHFAFEDGSTLEVRTWPPETSHVTLALAAGFQSEEEGRQLLESYVRKTGFVLDWSEPEERNENGQRVLTYSVGDPGHNAGASLVYSKNRLTAIRFTMAL